MTDEEPGLRARLVATGVELVAEGGVQALTLREIARRAGVSHGAPRRHFPTHRELLSAIAREGFGTLAARVARAVGDEVDAAGPRERIERLAHAYLDFARDNRGMHELMFRHDLLESGQIGLREVSLPLFGVLADLVSRAGTPSGAPASTAAVALWANLHGIAQLGHGGSLRLVTGADDTGPLLRAALDAYLGPAPERR
ncbi:TetR/AcrR family transcriptional regulator [Streptomyces sp. NPDC005805]|uniref:TetR/AcrR family transcriptional regulator n=1 Tax=Streptomyces sp. NPDC005805 TaxID=3157068 RepID=UPI0033E590D0